MPLTRFNYINTGKDGALGDTATADIDEMFVRMREQQKVVLHFHGGLVNKAAGLDVATRLFPDYEEAGAYPIFFVWESGLMEIVPRNLMEIVGEDIFKILLKRVAQFALGKLQQQIGAKSLSGQLPTDLAVERELRRRHAGQEPFAAQPIRHDVPDLEPQEQDEFERALTEDPDFEETVQAIAESVLPDVLETRIGTRAVVGRQQRSGRTLMSPEVVDELADGVRQANAAGARGLLSSAQMIRRAVRILARVITRFREDRDHGFYPTIVEEILRELYVANIGGNVWAAMKKETADTFGAAVPERGGAYFVRGLAKLLTDLPPDRWPEITLVGHSTGAVFINNLLAAVRGEQHAGRLPQDFTFRQIVLLAPACTFDHFAGAITEHGDLFRGVRLFGMQDTVESEDAMIPFVYTRSLLYFVSGLLEEDEEGKAVVDMPMLGMERYFTKSDVYAGPSFDLVRTFLADRLVWSVADAPDGLASASRKHGDFDNDEVTRASLAWVIRQGIPVQA